jgi:hypothetical protein
MQRGQRGAQPDAGIGRFRPDLSGGDGFVLMERPAIRQAVGDLIQN